MNIGNGIREQTLCPAFALKEDVTTIHESNIISCFNKAADQIREKEIPLVNKNIVYTKF